MKSPIETIHITQAGKEQLIKLKRITGIEQWNILCRWALLYSLADSSEPTSVKIPVDSNLEMNWKTFAGNYAEVLHAALVLRHKQKGTRTLELGHYFRLHLHRGISALANKRQITSLDQFLSLVG
jgi:DNA sulfur modification protein DndE